MTVEGELVKALSELVPGLEGVSVGGRTDRGVSAARQVISFHCRKGLTPSSIERAIDEACPGAISCLEARRAPSWFHAQHSARWRRYVYLMDDVPDLEVARVDRLLCGLIGRHDFSAYARQTPAGKSTVRKLLEARARRSSEGIRFDFKGESFLRRQVRVMVSTAVREALAGADDDALIQLARTLDRNATEYPADPRRLVLDRVGY